MRPWTEEQARTRLPDPADAVSATRAGRWQTVAASVDPAALPVTLEIREGELAWRAVRVLGIVALVAAVLLGGGGWMLYRETVSPEELLGGALLLPGMLLGLAAWIGWVHRRTPRWERLRLAVDAVGYESENVRWVEPVTGYAGMALRRRRTQQVSRRRPHVARTAAERALRVGEDVELWWVEMVHDDPLRTVVVWASSQPFASTDGLELVERLGEVLRLPVLSRSGIRWVEG